MAESKDVTRSRSLAEDEVRALFDRARTGDTGAMVGLREAMARHPELWKSYGDLALHAQDAWINLCAGRDLAMKESLAHRIDSMREELAGPDPSPLEGLLVERIVACWLQVSYADAGAAQAGEISLQQANYIRKRQDSAHRRYLTALGTLAMTRRLLGSNTSPSAGRVGIPGMAEVDIVDGNQDLNSGTEDLTEEISVLEFGPAGEGKPSASPESRNHGTWEAFEILKHRHRNRHQSSPRS